MHEILAKLGPATVVLDLGCAKGSFPRTSTRATVIRIDRDVDLAGGELVVQGDAAHLPFPDSSIDAVVANHSLEHFEDLQRCMNEIRRVIKPQGALFVSVPDASTMTDKLYRWLARGGGHVNAFVAPEQVIRAVEDVTGLTHVATRTLCSSLSFLNRRNSPRPRPRRLLLVGGGLEASLLLYTWLSRRIDRALNLRTSVYGWAFYFGNIPVDVDTTTDVNVCVRCGSAGPAGVLHGRIRRTWYGLQLYSCPCCGATNTFAG
jgi:SAM-dependent methyltransferase